MNNWRLTYFSQIQAARRNADGTVTIFRHVKTEAGVFKNTEHTYPDIGRPERRSGIINQALMKRIR